MTLPNRFILSLIYLVCLVAAVIFAVWTPIAILFGSKHAIPAMLGADRMANAVFGGSDKETISSRAGRGAQAGDRKWCLLCRVLDWFEKDHCNKSIGV